ncbi:MAG: M14 family metallopeptidase [Lachnospiraceae bacterium]|nr:M14 family metallopeptidase [Lachnospiraceae bacterium]
MIKNVASVGLPVDEVLNIRKMRVSPEGKDGGKRICIVTGTHGDELEGQFVCYEVLRRIRERRDLLTGTVDIYPAMNPLGIDSLTRGIPAFDLDMNRLFPGNRDGSMTEYVAAEICEDLDGADVCIDIHASNIFLTEMPQARINVNTSEKLVPMAKKLNLDFIWVHAASTVLESTLAHTMNSRGVPTIVVEMGVGMRITKEYGQRLTDGIFHLMYDMGIWQEDVPVSREPVVSEDGKVSFLNATHSGIFIKNAMHGDRVKAGDFIGSIVNPMTGEELAHVVSPVDGLLFTIREYPVVDEGSLIARILEDVA